MKDELPIIYLAKHGETAWTLSGQHTGLTDLPLTERGERTARRLGKRLRGLTFAKYSRVRCSAHVAHANWQGLARRQRSTPTSLNGTMASMRTTW
jgi:bisphosphoglycerate-dependent phosphoglycerate mutase